MTRAAETARARTLFCLAVILIAPLMRVMELIAAWAV